MKLVAAKLNAPNRALKIMDWNYLNLLPGTQVLKLKANDIIAKTKPKLCGDAG